MLTLTHTTHAGLTPHIGLCLTDSERARYGEIVYAVTIDTSDLSIGTVEIDRADRDANVWPGDTAASRAELIEEGYDIISYEDEDDRGVQHQTWRLLTPAAVAACTVAIVVAEEE